jgi:hypothetical protein
MAGLRANATHWLFQGATWRKKEPFGIFLFRLSVSTIFAWDTAER